jgi:hypothetical protein
MRVSIALWAFFPVRRARTREEEEEGGESNQNVC